VNDSRDGRNEVVRLVLPVHHHHRVLKILLLIPVLSQMNPLPISHICHTCYVLLYPLNPT
jgi:hypothetical protein